MENRPRNHDPFAGCLLGTASGDALGLPYEGLAPVRARKLLGEPTRFRFLFGRGMVSDDTEHACLTWEALLESDGDDERFARGLARRLRVWFLGLPPGIGLATARACLKLLLGWGPRRSGVFSAGNGPAMRAPILGAAIDDLDQLRRLVRTSSRITHTDPIADQAAFVIAVAAWTAKREASPDRRQFFARIRDQLGNEIVPAVNAALCAVESSMTEGQSTSEFAASFCGSHGVSGYALQTMPVVVQAWLSHPQDYQAAVTCTIQCGGDADSTAAMVGGIVGTGVGSNGLPQQWLDGLVEWPLSVRRMRQLANQTARELHGNRFRRMVFFPATLLRNLFVLGIVLVHGFRRLLPPY